jgi:putative nucleotidyltransferase with HDIG domain
MESVNKSNLLIVDDEVSILCVVGDYFRRKGYHVLTAHNGMEALDILKSTAVACCFTDLNMPDMDGMELTERIHETDNALPVIVMTGYPSLDNSIATLKNGVVDFLVKPVNLSTMELSLKRALQQRSLLMENLLLKEEAKGKDRLEQLNRELLHKIDELNTLNRIMGHFSVTFSSTHVFQRAVDLAREVVGADHAGFWVITGSDGQACEVAAAGRPALSLCDAGPPPADADAKEPGLGGLEPDARWQRLVRTVSADEAPLVVAANDGANGLPAHLHSLIAVPVKIRDRIFGVLTVAAWTGGKSFTEKDLFYLSFTTQSAANAIETLALYENLYENLFATLYGFVNALEARDLYTRQHSTRVTRIALELGRELGCSPEDLNVLNFAGPLHDIGKIGIRDDILLKPGQLSAEEFEKIKEHPIIGANMLTQLGIWERERAIIRCHHERFDGRGYPDGLHSEDIPFLARILSVADAYDAMASDRAYRRRMEEGAILRIVREAAGTQFDPRVVEAFMKVHGAGKFAPAAGAGDPP